MGWLQYSRPLWLSRGNHYILYLKAITAQMLILWADFPQRSEPRSIGVENRSPHGVEEFGVKHGFSPR
jgi:hypothetical protein